MSPTAVVLGVGPGLGMSIAHRFGREGYDVVLLSRRGDRHGEYLKSLADAGVQARAFAVDVRDHERLLSILDEIGPVDVVYYGPGATDLSDVPGEITTTTSDDARAAMNWLYPAVDVVQHVLPGVVERGGGLLFAGGLSAVRPMPVLGALALSSAALRNYAVTLNAALAEKGVYAGTLTIGGVVERGDIHQTVKSMPERFGSLAGHTLDPDDIAETAWQMFVKRDRAEEVFSAL
ncbi:SDR family NAD(P)-dependent oxidoreductase [Lentzea flaviverrucosa]|uniref:Short-chain dehydrogenase n=1 Tax=Lentzea flaviverrucosa TaxID=200379 RepID=A0A1H9XJ55_9PSEU|nr:SDR family NAD(P)-dependent oxidoreductase [Lentzea flaviverrucosa]RDI20251.1 short-subunit dehydrogenase [Lentzea flaviverrucosa]SES46195.1 Short-chain dehydrogenase [Lentzea flaviverrucosa]